LLLLLSCSPSVVFLVCFCCFPVASLLFSCCAFVGLLLFSAFSCLVLVCFCAFVCFVVLHFLGLLMSSTGQVSVGDINNPKFTMHFSSLILSSCDHRPQGDNIKLEKKAPTQETPESNTEENTARRSRKHTADTQSTRNNPNSNGLISASDDRTAK
jgi:hypothetical protein